MLRIQDRTAEDGDKSVEIGFFTPYAKIERVSDRDVGNLEAMNLPCHSVWKRREGALKLLECDKMRH